MFSFTRIGADYLTSVGLTVDPQRQSYMFAFQISPRLSPNMRLGSGVGPEPVRLAVRADPMTRSAAAARGRPSARP